jgi:hypothetical protein
MMRSGGGEWDDMMRSGRRENDERVDGVWGREDDEMMAIGRRKEGSTVII